MRRIGTISGKEDAERFRDYLLTQQIQSQVEAAGDDWAVWVYDEDQVEPTKTELARYLDSPRDERYQQAVVAADRIRHEKAREAITAQKKQVNLTQRWNRPLIRQIPVTCILVALSVIVTLGTQFGANLEAFGGQIPIISGLTSDGERVWGPKHYEPLGDVADGEVWRLVTPVFLHFDVLHLFFDLYWLVLFGGMIERARGSLTMAGLFLVTAIVGNVVQLYWSGPGFGGISGVDAGLFGYLWITGQMEPQSGLVLPQHLVFIMIGYLLLGTTGALEPILGHIANGAHLGGLFAGMAVAAASAWWRGLRST